MKGTSKKWTDGEKHRLRALLREGKDDEQVAKELGRSLSSIHYAYQQSYDWNPGEDLAVAMAGGEEEDPNGAPEGTFAEELR
jgi:transposase